MKRFVLVLIGVSSCYAQWPKDFGFNIDQLPNWDLNVDNENANKNEIINIKNETEQNEFQKYDFRDEDDQKVRPCAVSDWDCMRNFMSINSGCKISKGPAPDPLIIPFDRFFFPLVNLTVSFINLHEEGLQNARVTEFYVNKITGNLVIAVNVQKLRQISPKTYLTYHRTAKEPIILSDYSTVTYKSVTLTAVIPNFPNLNLELAEIHADVDDSTPIYVVGPGAVNSTDPDVVTALAEANANLPIATRESFEFHSYLLTSVFIQKQLCDFGVDVYNNYLKFITTKSFSITPNKYFTNKIY